MNERPSESVRRLPSPFGGFRVRSAFSAAASASGLGILRPPLGLGGARLSRKHPSGAGNTRADPEGGAAAMAAAAAAEDRWRRAPAGVTRVPAEPGEEEEEEEEEEETGELDRLRAQLGAALTEMENMKAVAEVSESTKAEAVAAVQRQCREEVASLQTILKDSISSYEAQISSLEQERRQEQQSREARERELSRLKQLLSRSHPLDSLEKQMEKAHEDSEKLREIVLPMEQEIAELKGKLLRAEELIQEIRRGEGSLRPRRHSLHGSAESLPLPRDPSPPAEQPEDLGGDGGVAAEAFARNCGDSASLSSFSFSLGGPGSSASLPRGHRGLSPEQEETASLVSTGTLVPEGIYLPPSGYQLVPDHQWEQLQLEGRQQQESVQQLQSQLESAGRERDGLQEALNRSNEDCARQVQVLLDQIQNSERLLQSLQGTVSQAQERAQQQMAELAASHKRLCYEVKCLNEENEGLRGGRPTPLGPQEQEDREPLPNSVPELQRLLREAQQELRGCRQAREHEAERLRIEIVNLRETLDEQTAARARLEGTLRGQREETQVLEASLCSLRTEMERIQQEQRKAEEQQLEEARRDKQPQPQQTPAQDWAKEKAQLQSFLSEQRGKVQWLQVELETSEQVQRDFVRLSQALQVRLERIRQAESLEQVRSIVDETPLRDISDIKET
ncbi:LOW QUALITY PROTEIN: rab GTPase-binding effector protein 2 [Tachyglossus aculeatus]|uniref:LOW QUALITY PROTEIN: rab GTPase-binding effector protein 2 n=1 Tax=Tachyglossus aculeatus TaxID=9261 RepID=UPI0018F750FB|nr:LOW QUALITY PROTEIN: rab GTPase-binding effector protein 2 [Tachyglossus aculeatus]